VPISSRGRERRGNLAGGWRNFERLMEDVDRIAGEPGAAALADETGRALEMALSRA